MPRSTVRRKLAADGEQSLVSLLEFTEPRRPISRHSPARSLARGTLHHHEVATAREGTNRRRQGEVTTIAEEEAPRLLPPRFIVFLGPEVVCRVPCVYVRGQVTKEEREREDDDDDKDGENGVAVAAERRSSTSRCSTAATDRRTKADHLSRAGRRKGRGIAGGCNPRLVIRAAAF